MFKLQLTSANYWYNWLRFVGFLSGMALFVRKMVEFFTFTFK